MPVVLNFLHGFYTRGHILDRDLTFHIGSNIPMHYSSFALVGHEKDEVHSSKLMTLQWLKCLSEAIATVTQDIQVHMATNELQV